MPTRAATGNNGSAFAGLNANTPWYNLTLGLAMLIGRFLMIVRCWRWREAWRQEAGPRFGGNVPDARRRCSWGCWSAWS